MKVKAYMRVAKGRNGVLFVDASERRDLSALLDDTSFDDLPTLHFAIELEVPREAFERADQVVAQVRVPAEHEDVAVVLGRTA